MRNTPQSEMSSPLVSVIIVNYNGRHHLERCLPSVLQAPELPVEVIVVDNASADGSQQWLQQRHPEVRVLALPRNEGFGKANAAGAAIAQGEKIAFLNSDTEVTPGWLIPLNRTLDTEPAVQATCSLLYLMKQREIVNAVGGGMSRLGYSYDRYFGFSADHPRVSALRAAGSSLRTLFPTAAAMLMRRADFDRLGGFDPAYFMYHEDVDLGWRIWLAGGEVHVCPDSVVYHYFGGTTKALQPNRFRDWMGMRHNVRSLLKCYQPRRVARVLFDHFRLWLRRRAFAEMTYVLGWNLLHAPGTFRQRWRIQRSRKRDDRELFEAGLVLYAEYPPSAPQVPASPKDSSLSAGLISPVLRVPDETAVERLGAGWYGVEYLPNPGQPDDRGSQSQSALACRWTNGLASARLRVGPAAKGTLRVRYCPPAPTSETEPAWMRLASDGREVELTFPPGSPREWQTAELPATADDNGLVTLEVASSTWIPHRTAPNEEGRLLGCAVHDIRFRWEEPPEAKLEATAANLSVIIPTYNRKHILGRTLSALQAQTLTGFEVIVVDDGSTDGTPEAIETWRTNQPETLAFELKVLRQPNLKQGQARNLGLKTARGEIVLFLGDDIIPDPGFVEAHLTGHAVHNEAGDVAIVGLTDWDVTTVNVTPFLQHVNYYGAQFGYAHLTPQAEAPFTCFYTSNVSLRRSALGTDPFDPRFGVYGWEDTELGYRLSRAGLRIIYSPEARAVHSHPMTLQSFLMRQTQVGAALDTFLKLQPDILDMPSMASCRRYRRLGILAPVITALTPVLSYLDRISTKTWPLRFYSLILSLAFEKGVRQAERTR